VRRVLPALVIVALAACGGDDGDGGTTTVAVRACDDMDALRTVDAETLDEIRAIADRSGMPPDLAGAIDAMADVIANPTDDASIVQQRVLAYRELCAGYAGD
jgi:hypothetical protein